MVNRFTTPLGRAYVGSAGERCGKGVPFFVAPGMARTARAAGFTNVRELSPWQSRRAGSLAITATLGRDNVPEVTYVIQGYDNSVFFGGDAELIPALNEVA